MLNLEAVASDMEELAESLKSITISHNSLVGAVDDIKEDVRETVKIIQGKLKMVPMYLTEDAKLWWRTKVEETILGQCSIASWDDFKREFKAQFYPENVAYNTRCKLNDLQQTGSIREYVAAFLFSCIWGRQLARALEMSPNL
ncbi:hypothetical protein GH714_035847 [Hevea brasiliensis]|uniref:Retrotransposon gag domain-containing protein n=1 Tax=Hevea brasiliensis TaxID=3981 RepID=A0A6A6NEG5_HEVBR|nr:hypothetical protein GH714_035847 [Hevea brasiliensis]